MSGQIILLYLRHMGSDPSAIVIVMDQSLSEFSAIVSASGRSRCCIDVYYEIKFLPKAIHNFVLKKIRAHRVHYLGGVLGEAWGVLGRLGVSWRHFDASCGRPGGVLGRLGSVLGRKRWPTWLQLGSQNGTKIEKNGSKKRSKF